MKATNFPEDIASIQVDSFENLSVKMFGSTSMQIVAENGCYPELNEETLTLEMKFIFTQVHELVVRSWQVCRCWEEYLKLKTLFWSE